MAVTYQGSAVHATVVKSKRQAIKDLATYMRTNESYDGPANLPAICDWLVEHDDRLGVEIFNASMDLG